MSNRYQQICWDMAEFRSHLCVRLKNYPGHPRGHASFQCRVVSERFASVPFDRLAKFAESVVKHREITYGPTVLGLDDPAMTHIKKVLWDVFQLSDVGVEHERTGMAD